MIPEPTEALPPCPLCGSDDLTEYHKDDPRNHCVACDRCEASAPFSAWKCGKAFKRLANGEVGQPENLAFNGWQMAERVLGKSL
jgi:hypothetical protein